MPESGLTKDFENMFCKRRRVSKGKELFVDPRKFILVELARRTILDESLVPERDEQ